MVACFVPQVRFDVLGDGKCDAARFSLMCESSEAWQEAGEQLGPRMRSGAQLVLPPIMIRHRRNKR